MLKTNIEINPSTKVYDLLNTYPELEETLIGIAPPFKKLRNPILRKSIAKIATLKNISSVGNIPLNELINKKYSEQAIFFDTKLAEEIKEYLCAINQAIKGEVSIYQLERQLKTTPFDQYSMLIPKLDKYARIRGYDFIMYLPFNLADDYVYG